MYWLIDYINFGLISRETVLSSSASTLSTRSCSRFSLSSHWRQNRWHITTSSWHHRYITMTVSELRVVSGYWCINFVNCRIVSTSCLFLFWLFMKLNLSSFSAGRICSGGDPLDAHWVLQQQGGLWPHRVQTGESANLWKRQTVKS